MINIWLCFQVRKEVKLFNFQDVFFGARFEQTVSAKPNLNFIE